MSFVLINEGLTFETPAPYANYSDNHKYFNLELPKL